MQGKKLSIVTIALAAGILLFLTGADLINKDRRFSETENRILASRPDFTWKTLFAGEFTRDYEEYVTDQFVFRNGWISVKTQGDIVLGKKDIGGVYLARDGSLIEQHTAGSVDAVKAEKKLRLLEQLVRDYEDRENIGSIRVLLAPTADNVLTGKLPEYADYYEQSGFLEEAVERIGTEAFLQLLPVMRSHADEYIYYKTDHHWTTLGAYYGYTAWAESMGLKPVAFDENTAAAVTKEFLGTLHSKVNIPVAADTILAYRTPFDREYKVYYDLSMQYKTSLYEEKYLAVKNKYGYFLDDNHGIIHLETGINNGKTLFVIKDSFANCFIPFAAEHYETVCIIDLRYYNMDLYEVIDSYVQAGETDLLVLYDVIHFINEFQYY